MWLLNSCTWEMKEFISHKQAPPYAILSHTWGDEEVSFREWQYEPLKFVGGKEGFNKIKLCCQQAATDGLEWVWVDTCCIDKSSSAELTEAINSMFRWYQNAAVCYTHLYDVVDDIESNLAGSRWVTRGWTLQELIAPREVIFYSSGWQALGTRSKLSAHLATVTRINESFLTGTSLDKASIAQRMSWAAKRTTSREEDMAYCLLGIFNVNMPMIYGEGQRAFRRLQEILVHEYPKDHSLFAWGKIVNELPNGVYDEEQKWGSKPVQFEPDLVTERFFGLLAESPKDFEHSGQVVSSPSVENYFWDGSTMPSVPSLVGHAAHVQLPMLDIGPYIAIHRKRSPIALSSSGQSSRMYEIIISDSLTPQHFSEFQLVAKMRKLIVTPLLLNLPQATDLESNPKKVAFGIVNKENDCGAPAAGELLDPLSFQNVYDASRFIFNHSEDIKYTHDMVVPRDEWRFSITGIADVYISLERVFLDEYDSDDDSNEDELHRFIDVLDFVVKNPIRDDVAKRPGDQQDDREDGGQKDKGSENTDENTKEVNITQENDNTVLSLA
ncbi:hypothetical protein E0Z10_g7143 [Xylaria hypoxylon]|uniref:Uncharacterized protein n=1 Tax=Xylaria hypoxylon TaxID=37992 RepID=A0A4Z0YCC7_9PEZI|nr:hypothetical protein E0Z10_g7143 [Xylaria hypoxylon]